MTQHKVIQENKVRQIWSDIDSQKATEDHEISACILVTRDIWLFVTSCVFSQRGFQLFITSCASGTQDFQSHETVNILLLVLLKFQVTFCFRQALGQLADCSKIYMSSLKQEPGLNNNFSRNFKKFYKTLNFQNKL